MSCLDSAFAATPIMSLSAVFMLASVLSFASSHHCMPSPPAEILGKIFSATLRDYDDSLDSEDRRQVVNLGLVCREWREASLLENSLWSSVQVWDADVQSEQSYDRIAAWLSRSSAPRTLARAGYCGKGCDCALASPIFVKLLTEGPMLDCLRLSDVSQACLKRMLRAIQATPSFGSPRPWDDLQALSLWFVTRWDQPKKKSQSIFYQFPHVKILNLKHPGLIDSSQIPMTPQPFPRLSFDVPVPFLQNLTSFKYDGIWSLESVLTAIKSCKNLETLALDLSGGDPSIEEEKRSADFDLQLPKLRYLRLENTHPALYNLDAITAPVLETLEMKLDSYFQAFNKYSEYNRPLTKPLLSFLERSQCHGTLRSLRVEGRMFNINELAPFLVELHALEELTLDAGESLDNSTEFWGALKEHVQDGQLQGRKCLPRLKVIDLTELQGEDSEEVLDDVFGFLYSRGPQECRVAIDSYRLRMRYNFEYYTEYFQESWREVAGEVSMKEFGIYLTILKDSHERCGDPVVTHIK